MTEQVCPHCDKVITDKDLANYPTKLEERRLRNEYFSSGIYRKHNWIFGIFLFLGILVTCLPIMLMMNDKFLEYGATLLGLEIVAGSLTIIWVIYSSNQDTRFQNEYVQLRLRVNNQ